jgi:hypothetical protein
MKMLETVQTFIGTVRSRGHIRLLIDKTELTVRFITNEKEITLVMKNGEADIIKNGVSTCTIDIYGEEMAIKALLKGSETLRALAQKGVLKVSIPFRTVLLLESLFYLAKNDESQLKII